MGALGHGLTTELWCLPEPRGYGAWPNNRANTPYPGAIHSREAAAGELWVHIPPLFPRVCPPRMAPHIRGSLVGTSQES